MLKLNLGCGHRKFEGFVNVDSEPKCSPDQLVDLESLPWPWADSSVEEIQLIHVLEHLGRKPEIFLGIMREMYRVCAPNAVITIIVPHHRHDDFSTDPTHVRVISQQGLSLFDRKKCENAIERGGANTPLAVYCGVDFAIESTKHDADAQWKARLDSGEISLADLNFAARHYNNVVRQTTFQLRVRKTEEPGK